MTFKGIGLRSNRAQICQMSQSLNGRKTVKDKIVITEMSFYFLKWTEEGWNITRADPSVFSSVGDNLTKNWVQERKVNKKSWIDFVLILNIHVWVSLRRNNFS